jgi:hypothetical protein
LDICITGMKRWKGMSGPGWRNRMGSLFNDGFDKLVRYWQTCVGGEWSWLCGEEYTGDKRAHVKTYFRVSLFLIKTKSNQDGGITFHSPYILYFGKYWFIL